jgi:hypothetical protein
MFDVSPNNSSLSSSMQNGIIRVLELERGLSPLRSLGASEVLDVSSAPTSLQLQPTRRSCQSSRWSSQIQVIGTQNHCSYHWLQRSLKRQFIHLNLALPHFLPRFSSSRKRTRLFSIELPPPHRHPPTYSTCNSSQSPSSPIINPGATQ